MSQLLGSNDFVMMIVLFVFGVFVFSEIPSTMATGRLDLLGGDSGFSGRDELVEWAGYGEEKLSTVVIGGKVLCRHGGGQAGERISIHSYNPVSGATVAVFCHTSAKTKKPWAKGRTDSSGNFLIDLPSHLHAIPNLDKICHVKVVHLPKTSPCFSGRSKRKPMELVSVGDGIRSYTTNDLHLMPPQTHMKNGN